MPITREEFDRVANVFKGGTRIYGAGLEGQYHRWERKVGPHKFNLYECWKPGSFEKDEPTRMLTKVFPGGQNVIAWVPQENPEKVNTGEFCQRENEASFRTILRFFNV